MREACSIFVLTSALLTLCGCPSIELARPVVVTEDTFSIDPAYWDKNVACIEFMVKDETADSPEMVALIGPAAEPMTTTMEDPSPFASVWALRAIAPVSAQDFRVTPGVVPRGFEQLVPEGGQPFRPAKGQEYYVYVCLDPVEESFYSLSIRWTPSGDASN
jgi:hypothetical protein